MNVGTGSWDGYWLVGVSLSGGNPLHISLDYTTVLTKILQMFIILFFIKNCQVGFCTAKMKQHVVHQLNHLIFFPFNKRGSTSQLCYFLLF